MKQIQKIIIMIIGLNIIATTIFIMLRGEYFKLDSIPEIFDIEQKNRN